MPALCGDRPLKEHYVECLTDFAIVLTVSFGLVSRKENETVI